METSQPAFVIRRRKPRGRPILAAEGEGRGVKNAENNYLAETPKNPVGAKPGNRNAVTHGASTAQNRARMAKVRAAVRDLRLRAQILMAMVDAAGKTRR